MNMKPQLKLYLISQTTNNNWDTYDSAVVASFSEEGARSTHPDGGDGNDEHLFLTWTTPDNVMVKYLGLADESILRAGVICASFNAG